MIKNAIKSYKDLDVFNNSYKLMLRVAFEVLPILPAVEKYDLKSQLSRSSKSIPRLIAEGYGKRQQRLGFQKYLCDALAETNETMVSLEQARDLYAINSALANELIDGYDKVGKQLYNLAQSWGRIKMNNNK